MTRIPPELEGEFIIRIMDMPECLNGMVKYDENDFANIYVNARLNTEGRRKAADHELTHVINDDIHNDDDIRTIEARADGLPFPLKPIPHLMRACDLLPQTTNVAAAPAPPRSQSHSPVPISPHQAAVMLHAVNDLDNWLFRDATYDL